MSATGGTEVRPGQSYPLGATWDGAGVNFALFSEHATGVELRLFVAPEDSYASARLAVTEQTDQVWHIYFPQARPSQGYGCRVDGSYDPAEGQRVNRAKLLLHPYAKAIAGTMYWSDALFAYTIGHPDADLSCDARDGAGNLPKPVVVDPAFSWGSDASHIVARRTHQQRSFLATSLLSQGGPVVLAGDEIGRTQQGNNSVYCQDNNEVSWVDGQLDRPRRELLTFPRAVIRLFHQNSVRRRRQFCQGRSVRGSEVQDLAWSQPDAKEMTEDDWSLRCIGLRLAADGIDEMDEWGNRLVDDTVLILLNAHHEALPFVLQVHRPKARWDLVFDTRATTGQRRQRPIRGGEPYELEACSLALLRLRGDEVPT